MGYGTVVDCGLNCVMFETTYLNVQEDAEDLKGTYGYWKA